MAIRGHQLSSVVISMPSVAISNATHEHLSQRLLLEDRARVSLECEVLDGLAQREERLINVPVATLSRCRDFQTLVASRCPRLMREQREK